MEQEQPSSIEGLAHLLDIPWLDVIIPCTFCGRYLSQTEKVIFDQHNFKIRWVGSTAFACCQNCFRISGALERQLYEEQTVKVTDLCRWTGLPLCTQIVRCTSCLRPFSWKEKHELEERSGATVVCVRGGLRSLCSLCCLR
uniref:Protein E6 n=1 Tax=Bat papillomavirus TaxID=2004707 RepID=A0A2Z2JNQ0_9PAPI|nr:E6 [Bat papillomavirus]